MGDIKLANGKGIALIDDEDVGRIPLTGWHRHPQGYASHRWQRPDGTHTHILLHRLVMQAVKGQELDHINHDKLDCRKANLRFVTRAQNNQNWPGPLSVNKLGVKGVIKYRSRLYGHLFRASVQVAGKVIHRHGFRTLAEAELAAIDLRRMYHTHGPENRA